MPPRFGDYMKATSGGTNAAASSSYGSTSNQGGGPAGMTFNEAANAGIMSQQEAQQAQQAINQQASQSGQGSTTDTAAQIRARKEKEEAESLAAKGKDIAQGIMTTLMGGGEGGNLNLTREEAYADLPANMHPLRKQYEYLTKKYGPAWQKTTQAKVLENALAGTPVERGGGLGAQDKNYGLTGDEAKEFQSKLLLDEDFMDAENYRQRVLNQFGGKLGTIGSDFVSSDFLKDLDIERLREGLSPEQYFNFRQQLMAADPTAENQLYKDTFPYSSGAGLSTLFEKFAPLPLKAIAGMFPERDLSGYQGTTDDVSVNFRPLPAVEQSDSNEPVRPPGFMPIIPFPETEPERPRYPLPGDSPYPPNFMPFPGMPDAGNFPLPKGINAFNPMFLGPSFRGSPYTNRGVSPAFYEALRRFS
jgi:hypothetical protein